MFSFLAHSSKSGRFCLGHVGVILLCLGAPGCNDGDHHGPPGAGFAGPAYREVPTSSAKQSIPPKKGAPAQKEWTTFKSVEGRFTVSMPAEPKEQKGASRTSHGIIRIHLIALDIDNNTSFGVLYADNPPVILEEKERGVQAILDKAVEGTVASMHAKLQKQKDVRIGNHPGREFTFHAPASPLVGDSKQGITRIYIVKDRLYQVYCHWAEVDKQTPADAQKFLSSFELHEPKNAPGTEK